MRIVLQRVREAWVCVDQREIARIGPGFLLFVGIGKEDTAEEILFWAKRIPEIRVFPDDKGKLNLSLREVKGEILCVSQFTLYGDVLAGRRPSFTKPLRQNWPATSMTYLSKLCWPKGSP
jgi:D-tyrosyl-tRNA(Tyr) deacylase